MATAIQDLPGELWKPVVGWESLYAVSNMGRVKSLPHWVERAHPRNPVFTFRAFMKGRVLAPQARKKGIPYVSCSLYTPSKGHSTRLIHQLVAEAFLGPRPRGMDVCHWDNNPANNRATNLRWDTRTANLLDRERFGTVNRGERNGHAKLTESDVLKIRAMAAQGVAAAALARQYSVAGCTIRDILDRSHWTHI